MTALRYGSVPYLNARPLLAGLAETVGDVRLELPGVLAGLLADGAIDVALAPVVVAFTHPELVVVPAGAVVAHGPVKSVLLFCRRPVGEVRTVGLDTSSRTSAALVRVLFEHRWGNRPEFVDRGPDPDLTVPGQDAVLLIGDPALQAVWDGPAPLDLGTEWTTWTGLPFVFAAWLARGQDIAEAAYGPLHDAAVRGRESLAAIAAEGAGRLGLDADEALHYLRHHLSFDFQEAERAGLARFRDLWERTPGVR